MVDSKIHKVLKQIDKGTLDFKRFKLICKSLCQLGLVAVNTETDDVVTYKLTIKGKIFIWDFENWKL